MARQPRSQSQYKNRIKEIMKANLDIYDHQAEPDNTN